MTLCFAGSYCPIAGVQLASDYFCPAGTFSALLGLSSVGQCQSCSAGSFCASAGQTAVSGACAAGYFCIGGATTPTPTDGIRGSLCPLGKICVAGTVAAASCPPGTLAPPTVGNSLFTACLACPAGFYCDRYGASNATAACTGGYVCTGSSNSSVPVLGVTGYACQAGTFCSPGALAPQLCLSGSYNPDAARSACSPCPSGALCTGFGLQNYSVCPQGSYCPLGSAFPIACPIGTFSAQYNLGNASQCTPCLRGQYCESQGLTAPTGLCIQGFFCNAGAVFEFR
jgi:hypothetical protein